MTFRTRLALSAGLAVAVAVVAASIGAYFLVQDQLVEEVDAALIERAREFRPFEGGRPGSGPPPRFGGAAGYAQVVTAAGLALRPGGEGTTLALPVSNDTRAVATGDKGEFFQRRHGGRDAPARS